MAARSSMVERERIGLGRAAGESLRQIARCLGRAPSTVSREVARFEKYGQRYLPLMADWACWLRHRRPGRSGRGGDPFVMALAGLEHQCPPG
ncbi:helix-turn-helix domain-containing protein [Actinoplanes sp. NPDC004185]